jgi:ribosomal protein RSM22 (predicted rRNA methylase)
MGPFNGELAAKLSSLVMRTIDRLSQGEGGRSNTVAQAVVELSRLFTKERAALSRSYLNDPDCAAAYCAYFLPVNLSKTQVLLDELTLEGLTSEGHTSIRVLDLGSGPGTGGLAVLDWLHQRNPELARRLSVLAVDSSGEALQQANDIWNSYCRDAGIAGERLTVCEGDLERSVRESWYGHAKERGPFDLIILANSLNELFTEALDPIALRVQLVADLLPLLKPHGTVMIVEPALRETSRALHEVRDRLLQEQRCTIYSPCLHERNCPALVNPDDWCHEERPWEPPARILEIDREVGFIKDALKFSYLLLRTDGRTIVRRQPDVYRVVSELREFKGEKRAWLCHEQGRPEVGRLDRMESPQNAAFDHWHRGAIVRISEIVRKERKGRKSAVGRIPVDAKVEIVRSI